MTAISTSKVLDACRSKPELVIAELWRRGDLRYKIRGYQVQIYDDFWGAINNPGCLMFCANLARRFGKSMIATIVAIEYAIRNPNSQIKFVCATQKGMRAIMKPILRKIFADCPKEFGEGKLLPSGVVRFTNGSEITFCGADAGNADNLRGTDSHLNFIDEAGAVDDLDYLINSVLKPMQLTVNGTMIVYSTPSKKLDHYYTKVARTCKEKGFYVERTIDDNKSITPAKRQIYIDDSGGEKSTTWRREYMVEFVNDENMMLIPEFIGSDVTEPVEETELRRFYHKYVSMDLGFVDFTAILYGYYDFTNSCLVIEREHTTSGNEGRNDILAAQIIRDEDELWGTCQSPHQADPKSKVYRRISDTNEPRLLDDLGSRFGLTFIKVKKNELSVMVDRVRSWVSTGRLRVHPSCEMLLGCLQFGFWNPTRTAMDHSDKYKHYDHLAALMYMVRMIDEHTNPIPPGYKLNKYEQHVTPQMMQPSQNVEYQKFANSLLGRRR